MNRGRAFGYLAAVAPAVYLLVPPLSGLLCDTVGWRIVPALTAAVAAVLMVMSMLSIPRDATKTTGREMLTPFLGGVVLTAVCLSAASLVEGGRLTNVTLATALVGAAFLVLLLRRLPNPGLDLRLLRTPGGPAATVAMALSVFVALSFYIGIYVQVRYHHGNTSVALLLAICGIGGVLGSLVIGRIAGRIGSLRAAIASLSMTTVLALSFLILRPSSPTWVVIVIGTLVSATSLGACGPVTENMLDHAPANGSEAASSLAEAAAAFGYVIGAVVIGVAALSGFERSLAKHLQEYGMTSQNAHAIAAELRAGTLTGDLLVRTKARHPELIPVTDADPGVVHPSQLYALQIVGVGLSVTSAAAALLLVPGLRRVPKSGQAAHH